MKTSSFIGLIGTLLLSSQVSHALQVGSGLFSSLQRVDPPHLATANDYLITSLLNETKPLIRDIPAQYAGYIPVSNYSDLFFWYFKSEIKDSKKLVICSSLLGSFEENGPIKFTKDGSKLYANHHSWHKQANLLYVEQPVGTGYSFTTGPYAKNETDVANDFYTFMNNFYTVFPEAKTWDLFITGESYTVPTAVTNVFVYSPYIAQKFLDEKVLNDGSLINLKALGIGNGFLDPYRLSPYDNGAKYYRDFYLARDFFGHDSQTIARWNKLAFDCTYVTFENYTTIEFGCDMASWASSWKSNKTGIECVDPYNVDHVCTDTKARDDSLSTFLNNPEVRKSLHVNVHVDSNGNPIPWTQCSDSVGFFLDDSSYMSYTIIPDLLNRGLPIVIYNGDRDSVCNYVGEEAILDSLTWNGAKGFQSPFPSEPNWILGTTQKAGYIRSERGLTYIRVTGAGHLVPMDDPAKGSLVLSTVIQAGQNDAHVAARR
ncbi:hypothetical protein HDU76_002418 [Blyttiomyces sp. JEL0837]|nr:hypothetical protein HDU76_002418 [Blyttiomyces sp. JEL0837]